MGPDDTPQISGNLSREDIQLALRHLMRRGLAAQEDLATFFEAVIRHETTKRPLSIMPHQRLLFSFVQAHPQVVVRMPIFTTKTFSCTSIGLFLTGNDVTQRGAIVSHSKEQAKKVLRMFRAYLEDDHLHTALATVFPHLRRSPRTGDPWKQDAIAVDRPGGIRDATVVACGINAKIHGSRLSWILCDDLVDDSNAYSEAERDKLVRMFFGNIVSRLDPKRSRAIVTNTPWDRKDLTFYLEERATWPTLTMNIDGYVRWTNARAEWIRGVLDSALRPARKPTMGDYDWYRMTAYGDDPEEEIPLCPELWSRDRIEDKRRTDPPHEFARLMMCEPFDAEAMRCQRSWIEQCKVDGMGTSLVDSYSGPNPTFTGVDLAIGKREHHDRTVFFTYELLPNRRKRLLDIESGRLKGPEIVDMIVRKADAYRSTVGVESNAAQQYILDFAQDARKDLRIRAHSTQATNKLNREFGVEGIFAEFRNGQWIIPCNSRAECAPEVQEWINECLFYQPQTHTGDRLAACWIASELARKAGGGQVKGVIGRARALHRQGQF